MSHTSPSRRPLRTRLLTGLVAAPLALGLVACGSSDSDDDGSSTFTPATSAPATSAPAPATTDAPVTTAPVAGDDSTLLAAARTALGAVSGSTLFSIDRDDNGGWDVSLVSADGTENEVDVSADGASITRGPVVDDDDNDDDTNDRAERVRLLGARVDYTAALETARGTIADGVVTSVDLDEDNGVATWDVQVGEVNEQTVVIDAASGAVLRTEQDD